MIRLKQSKTNISDVGVTSLAVTFDRPYNPGNLLVVGAFTAVASTDVVSSIVAGANTFTKIGAGIAIGVAGGGAGFGAMWYCANAVSDTTVVTMTLTSNPCLIIALEYEGVQKSSPLDKSSYGDGNGTTMSSGATAATTMDRELVVGFGFSDFGASLIYTLDANYADKVYVTSGNDGCTEAREVKTTGAQTATFTISGATDWGMGVATFFAGPDNWKLPNAGLRPRPFAPGLAR